MHTTGQPHRYQHNLLLWIVIVMLFACGCARSPAGYAGTDDSSVTSESLMTEPVGEPDNETTSDTDLSETFAETVVSEETKTLIQSSEREQFLSDLRKNLPEYSGSAYVILNENIPFFSEDDLTTTSFEIYSELDALGRCQTAYANIGIDLMPDEERESISEVEPTGWQSVTYSIIEDEYLYNRCHLIGYQLTGENANEKNLFTGTRYLNIDGMLPFENMVADYILETENHVLYQVTPIFEEDNLLASGVVMEAMSVEDEGKGILFCIYVFNVQPGIKIDYATGDSCLSAEDDITEDTDSTADNESAWTASSSQTTYILNTNSYKFHLPSCSYAQQISDQNRQEYTGTRDELIEQGYEPCKICNP